MYIMLNVAMGITSFAIDFTNVYCSYLAGVLPPGGIEAFTIDFTQVYWSYIGWWY